ncbi:MAG: hypothetical protein ACSLE6_09540 [Mycobacterium sp.]
MRSPPNSDDGCFNHPASCPSRRHIHARWASTSSENRLRGVEDRWPSGSALRRVATTCVVAAIGWWRRLPADFVVTALAEPAA